MTARKKPEDKKKRGRPTKYTPELAKLICRRIATNQIGIRKICKKYSDLPDPDTIFEWRFDYPEFSEQYAQAKLIQADLLAEETLEIADDASNDITYNEEGEPICNTEFINRSRLRIDTRKWLAAKLLPKQYGKPAEEVPKEKDEKDVLIHKLLDRLVD